MMSGKIIDLDSERTIRAGEQACSRWLASDPKLCEQAARYAAARAKLREGMRGKSTSGRYLWLVDKDGARAMKRRIIELYSHDFKWMRALERARLRGVPDVPAVKIYDALERSRLADISTLHEVMRALGCKCDDDDPEQCAVVRIVEVDDDTGLVLDEHPSEG